MNRRHFLASLCFTPVLFTAPLKPSPLKWRVTVELRTDGLVREIRNTDFRTREEAQAAWWQSIADSSGEGFRKFSITKI